MERSTCLAGFVKSAMAGAAGSVKPQIETRAAACSIVHRCESTSLSLADAAQLVRHKRFPGGVDAGLSKPH